ncbi:hypothetical protein B0H17DRAFT_128354 [Mycena rosella]|uniref:Uncharacterized protein n=1 Tax=Mycena rosella TaxID=1033263 RepID=A0AAD7D6G2_MYCRO|nr:hypothetical protein B0H17DRAFT_128354 [Mycena rosella]
MNKTIDVSAAWEDSLQGVIQVEIVLFMQGMNVLLVGVALWLLHRQRPPGAGVLSSVIPAMCILTTAGVFVDAATTPLVLRVLQSAAESGSAPGESLRRMKTALALAEDILVVTSNAVADGLLIYRCHAIWNNSRHRKLVSLPISLALATAVSGYVLSCQSYPAPAVRPDLRIFYGLVVATNTMVTGFTVGRILYISRGLGPTGQTRFSQRYNTALKMLLESAVIYLICSLVVIVQQSVAGFSTPIAQSRARTG